MANTTVAKTFKQFWVSTFRPELFSDFALQADPYFARYKSAFAQEKDALIKASESEWDYRIAYPACAAMNRSSVEYARSPPAPGRRPDSDRRCYYYHNDLVV